jgi:protein-disulfide isomerase
MVEGGRDQPQPAQTRLAAPVGERDHSLGPNDAPITLVEYGDYECPDCGTAHPVVHELRRRLGDRLRVVFRNFPCPDAHPHAQQAAEAAEAAGAQGKFWEMHDALFEHFDALEVADLARYAAELGLDVERFKRDLAEHAYAPRVGEDVDGGMRSGVNRTPTFFINGVHHGGFFSLPALLEAIEAAASPPAQAADRSEVGRDTPAADLASDKVAEASWESFPASDAPGWRDHA